MLSESEQASNAQAVFGTNAMSGFLALMNAAPSDITKLESAIDSCDGTAEKMAETINTTCFTSKIKCGNCGASYRRSGKRQRKDKNETYYVWVCQT